MANVFSIYSVADSIIQYLRNAYPAVLQDRHACDFKVLSSGELTAQGTASFETNTLSIYLFRVIINEHLRNTNSQKQANEVQKPLSVDLHFMLSFWSESALAEHTICAWAMRQLHMHPIMDMSSLTAEGGWDKDDVVHIIPAELSNEDLMRVWDALAPNYRLSVSYIARVIRIEPDDVEVEGMPVVTTRYEYRHKQGGEDV